MHRLLHLHGGKVCFYVFLASRAVWGPQVVKSHAQEIRLHECVLEGDAWSQVCDDMRSLEPKLLDAKIRQLSVSNDPQQRMLVMNYLYYDRGVVTSSKIDTITFYELFAQSLKDTIASVRLAAVETAGAINFYAQPPLYKLVVPLKNDQDPRVRQCALRTSENIKAMVLSMLEEGPREGGQSDIGHGP